jgi:hypothetical protein
MGTDDSQEDQYEVTKLMIHIDVQMRKLLTG